jgi:hypothetical protein
MLDIDVVHVLMATAAAFITGAIWYSPLLFLNAWTKTVGIDPNNEVDNPAKVYGLTFVFTLLAAIALAILIGPAPEFAHASTIALIVGVGIVASSLGINYQFAKNSFMHWLIDSGFHIVRMQVIALVLCL